MCFFVHFASDYSKTGVAAILEPGAVASRTFTETKRSQLPKENQSTQSGGRDDGQHTHLPVKDQRTSKFLMSVLSAGQELSAGEVKAAHGELPDSKVL